ncbi:uncharacterized protein LAJ45_02936 [Morchella importuna]|uniref:uncharacterized protein n=1 Tax=Morchella importuna TaxID=1174673 RepID=UPI001E8DD6B6|nr:uncharacterized protein LAJ45_02936 [Morchella importuna]KAH8152712.1 hypothetical protein LAJ45_02936 [Morchella importuna]
MQLLGHPRLPPPLRRCGAFTFESSYPRGMKARKGGLRHDRRGTAEPGEEIKARWAREGEGTVGILGYGAARVGSETEPESGMAG